MKIKYTHIKNPIFQLCLAVLITSCDGSGGGGSSTPRSIVPTKIIPAPQPDQPLNPKKQSDQPVEDKTKKSSRDREREKRISNYF